MTLGNGDLKTSPDFNISEFKENKKAFTIVDIRNDSEVEEGKIFETALTIPLHQLRERVSEIPNDKPIVVHCAGGYRSAAGSSILETELKNTTVFDLSDAVTEFQN